MSHRGIEALLWSVTLAGTVITAARLPTRGRRNDAAGERPVPVALDLQQYDEDVLLTAADSVTANDPFRLGRPPLASAAGVPPAPTAPVSSPLIPQLALGGIMGGPPWRAVITGFPGRDGSVVVMAGDTVGAFHVQSIRRDAVVVAGPDTTWTLTPR